MITKYTLRLAGRRATQLMDDYRVKHFGLRFCSSRPDGWCPAILNEKEKGEVRARATHLNVPLLSTAQDLRF
jgi:hypothetical protein